MCYWFVFISCCYCKNHHHNGTNISSKTGKKCIFGVLANFGLMSDSLTAIYVEPHKSDLHQSILRTQGPIHGIFMKNIENWQRFFWVGHFIFFFFKWKSVNIYRITRIFRNFDDYPDFQQKARGYKIMRNTVSK